MYVKYPDVLNRNMEQDNSVSTGVPSPRLFMLKPRPVFKGAQTLSLFLPPSLGSLLTFINQRPMV